MNQPRLRDAVTRMAEYAETVDGPDIDDRTGSVSNEILSDGMNAAPWALEVEINVGEPLGHGSRAQRRRGNASRMVDQHIDRTQPRTEEHTSDLQSLMRHSYAVF